MLCYLSTGSVYAQIDSYGDRQEIPKYRARLSWCYIYATYRSRYSMFHETAADGSAISFKYETPAKGGAGKILAGTAPFDGVSAKLIGDNTREASYMKGGKEIVHYREVVSKDGKTMRMTTKGTDAQGKPTAGVLIFVKS